MTMTTIKSIQKRGESILMSLALLSAVFSMTACSNSDESLIDENENGRFVTMEVSTEDPTTRIGFTDNGTNGVSVAWAANDKITVFKADGSQAGTLTLSTGAGTKRATFSGTLTATQGNVLTVCYPKAADNVVSYATYKDELRKGVLTKQTQTGNGNTVHLDKYGSMEGTVTMGSGSTLPSVSMSSKNTILTVKMPKPVDFVADDENVNSLVITLQDGSTNGIGYSLKLASITGWPTENGNTLTAHLIINPIDITNKAIDFRLTTTNQNNNNTFKGSITASKSYVAGKRYTATFTPVRRTFVVGDAYPNTINAVGVVYSITNGGKSGKVVSLDQVSYAWGPTATTTNATSTTDGATNLTAIKAQPTWATSYPGFSWANNHNSATSKLVWYLPAKDELTAIYAAKTAVDKGLTKVSGTTLGTGVYWSSTESTSNNAWSVDFNTGTAATAAKNEANNIRAVAAF